MCFWKYLSTFCCCIGAYYVERYIFIKQIFLCRALTSMCRFSCLLVCPSTCCAPYLRNCASSNHNFWYTCVKWWYLQGIFYFYLFFFESFIFSFFVSQELYLKWLWFLVHMWKMMVSPAFFFYYLFFQNCDFSGFSKFINKYGVSQLLHMGVIFPTF